MSDSHQQREFEWYKVSYGSGEAPTSIRCYIGSSPVGQILFIPVGPIPKPTLDRGQIILYYRRDQLRDILAILETGRRHFLSIHDQDGMGWIHAASEQPASGWVDPSFEPTR